MSVSPRPWKCVDGGINVYDVNGRHIFEVTGDDMCADDEDMAECRDNTDHIVRCVNLFDELVEALKNAHVVIDTLDFVDADIVKQIESVLKKVEEIR